MKNRLEKSERTVQNLDWLKDELRAIEDLQLDSMFMNLLLSGKKYDNKTNSSVAYLLGITDTPPTKYPETLVVDEGRTDFPDIDTDFQDSRRGEVKQYLTKKFKNVASISTYQYFKDKGVVRDAARVFMVPLHEVNKALKAVETFEQYETDKSTLEFRMEYPEVTDLARNLRGRIRGTGIHAAGIVVAKEPIRNYAPIETRADASDPVSGRIPVVAYDMDQAADIGLIKLDALGLKTLSVISDTMKMVEQRIGRKIVLVDIDLDDKSIYQDLSNGYTKGVFQAEATPYTNLLMKMGVDNFEDLVASNALVRPGAMNTVGGMYVGRKKGELMTEYVHPIMQPFLKNTYGVVIYQEQVMQACVYLAGMSWAEADKIRKIMVRKRTFTNSMLIGIDSFREQRSTLQKRRQSNFGRILRLTQGILLTVLMLWHILWLDIGLHG